LRGHRVSYEVFVLVRDLQRLVVEELEVLRVAEWGGISSLL
jgi:hypothetical protein